VVERGGRDSQIAEMMKMSKENIALVFRIPLQVLGLSGGQLHVDRSGDAILARGGLELCDQSRRAKFDMLFGLKGPPDEWTELSTDVLLRSAMKDRIESLARGVQGGIYSPNEARNKEDLDSVDAGDEPRVQQQVVPLSVRPIRSQQPGAAGPKIPERRRAASAASRSRSFKDMTDDAVKRARAKTLRSRWTSSLTS
jgi:hypothetical protein